MDTAMDTATVSPDIDGPRTLLHRFVEEVLNEYDLDGALTDLAPGSRGWRRLSPRHPARSGPRR